MASCDFSTHPYSYDDTDGDLQLSQFTLAPEDIKYKVCIYMHTHCASLYLTLCLSVPLHAHDRTSGKSGNKTVYV